MNLARNLYESGRAHALTSARIYQSSISDAKQNGKNPEHFAFNGIYSLSTHYLLGLGLELMLKASIVAWGGPSDERFLRDVGHDLIRALDEAEAAGFHSEAPSLREILTVMREPYQQHWFRYSRPAAFELPGDFTQVIAALKVLDDELRARIMGT